MILFLLASLGVAGQDMELINARSRAMGGSLFAGAGPEAFWQNPAGMADIPKNLVSLVSESRFAGAGIQQGGTGLALKAGQGAFSLGWHYGGYARYSQNKISLAYAMPLGNAISIGLRFNYLLTMVSEYGNEQGITAAAGIIYHPQEQWQAGLYIDNPSFGKSFSNGTPYPVRAAFGLQWQSSDNLLFTLALYDEFGSHPEFKAGMEYTLQEKLFLRTGFSSDPFQWSFGAGYVMNRFCTDAAVSFHPVLGFTPSISLNYEW